LTSSRGEAVLQVNGHASGNECIGSHRRKLSYE
jgi:hypothetical protein